MRTLLVLWLTPSALFWSWHLLATSDILFAREFHDRVLVLYGQLLGIEPAAVPMLFTRAVLTDGLLILAVVLFRRRRSILAAARRLLGVRRALIGAEEPAGPARPAG